MTQTNNVTPDAYSLQPPSYEECMRNSPTRSPQSSGPMGGLRPSAPPHAYVADTGMSEHERAKRERRNTLYLTIGLAVTVCLAFLFIMCYIKIHHYHEGRSRRMQNYFRMDNMENSFWSEVPEKTYHEHSSRIDFPRVSEQEIEDMQQQLKKILNSVTPLGFKNEDKPTDLNLETKTEFYELSNESPTVGLVNGTSD